MIKYPEHVAKSLMLKLDSYDKIEKEIGKYASHIIARRRKQTELMGEIKGMLQAEEYENESGTSNERPARSCKDS